MLLMGKIPIAMTLLVTYLLATRITETDKTEKEVV